MGAVESMDQAKHLYELAESVLKGLWYHHRTDDVSDTTQAHYPVSQSSGTKLSVLS